MKLAFIATLISMTSFAWASQAWKIVAETANCQDKLEVLAKEGEKFVYVVRGDKKTQLFSEDETTYVKDGPSMTTFSNSHDKSSKEKFTFIQPSMVDGNPPKLNVSVNNQKENCRMKLK